MNTSFGRHVFAALVLTAMRIGAANPTTRPVSFEIDGAKTYEISPLIYGANFPDWKTMAGKITFTRWGGNRTTAYNWETNASNAGADWHHQNDDFMGKSDVAGDTIGKFLGGARDAHAASVVTISCIGHVSADKKGDGDVDQTPDYLNTRFTVSLPKKFKPFEYPPDVTDHVVFQDELVAWIQKAFPAQPIFYALDNEPDIWSATHARIHPEKLTFQELIQINTDYASAIKDVAPDARVFGFCSYGWNGWHNLQNAPDQNGRDFFEFYCQEMKKAEQTAGRQLIDAIDVHYYPEARGGGFRVTEDKASPQLYAARIQAPRSLWDRSYMEDSWIVNDHLHKPMVELPQLQDAIAKNYPGTKLAICEYDFGGADHISGAIAQADALGIFGREGIYAASNWRGLKPDDYIYGAFRAFRDYDGKGGAFGATGLEVKSDGDPAHASLYASRNEKGQIVIVAINKLDAILPATIRMSGDSTERKASVYRIEAGNPGPKSVGDKESSGGALQVDLPPMSVSTIVIPPGK